MNDEDEIARMIDALGIEVPEQKSVTDMTNRELMDAFSALTQHLLSTGQTVDPTTEDGRETHSRRDAIHLELIRRRLM